MPPPLTSFAELLLGPILIASAPATPTVVEPAPELAVADDWPFTVLVTETELAEAALATEAVPAGVATLIASAAATAVPSLTAVPSANAEASYELVAWMVR